MGMFYALQTNGDLFTLGDHGDLEAAQNTAEDLELEIVLILDETTAEQWRNILNRSVEQ